MGGGIPEARVLYYLKYNSNTNNGHSVSGLDLDRYADHIVIGYYQYKTVDHSSFIVPAPFYDGLEYVFTSKYALGFKKRSDGLYDLNFHSTSEGVWNDYMFNFVLGIKPTTKTTEVSTMSINSDQPISAGNLKAALDSLTGGGRS